MMKLDEMRVISTTNLKNHIEWVRICPTCYPDFHKHLPNDLEYHIHYYTTEGKCSNCGKELMKG